MAKLKITRKPFLRVESYNGKYTTDVSDTDDEAMIRDFDFTVEVTFTCRIIACYYCTKVRGSSIRG